MHWITRCVLISLLVAMVSPLFTMQLIKVDEQRSMEEMAAMTEQERQAYVLSMPSNTVSGLALLPEVFSSWYNASFYLKAVLSLFIPLLVATLWIAKVSSPHSE